MKKSSLCRHSVFELMLERVQIKIYYHHVFLLATGEPLSVIQSARGRLLMSNDGFAFWSEKSTPNKIIWKCQTYHKTKCSARLHSTANLKNPHLLRFIGTHNHDAPIWT